MTLTLIPSQETVPKWDLGGGVTSHQESVYLRYLPAVYRDDGFLRQLLLIFESVLAPLERTVGTLPLYTEPEITPQDFLPWLAHWVAVSLDSEWPVDRQRALIAHAAEIYRWRGTRHGLKLHVKTYTGIEPAIQEHQDGFVLGAENRLAWTTFLQRTIDDPTMFVVTAPIRDPRQVDFPILRAIINENKPVHTTYRLRILRLSGGSTPWVTEQSGPKS